MSWWDNNVEKGVFKRWVKGKNAPTRKMVREHILSKGYTNVLDVGAGMCEDYFAFIEAGGMVHYSAVDITDMFIEQAQHTGIHIYKTDAGNLPFEDNSFDIAYCRHVIEHMPYYEDALNEMIRVSRSEVIVTFFLPMEDTEVIKKNNELHHNIYSKEKMISFLMKSAKVYDVSFEAVGDEEIMYISLK